MGSSRARSWTRVALVERRSFRHKFLVNPGPVATGPVASGQPGSGSQPVAVGAKPRGRREAAPLRGACAFLFHRDTRGACGAGIGVRLSVAAAYGIVVGRAGLGACLAFARFVCRAAACCRCVAAIETCRAACGVGGATGCSDSAGCCLRCVLAQPTMPDRDAVGVCHAVVAEVSTVAAAYGGPLFRAFVGSFCALTGCSDLAAVLRFAIFAKHRPWALGDRATDTTGHWTRLSVRA